MFYKGSRLTVGVTGGWRDKLSNGSLPKLSKAPKTRRIPAVRGIIILVLVQDALLGKLIFLNDP